MKHKVEVLYLSYDGLTDPLGQSQILPYLCGIAGNGYSITIISFEKKGKFQTTRQQILSICNTHHISWIPLPYHKTPPIISTVFDLFRLCRTVLKQHKRKRFSIVHCRSYITALIGTWMKQRYHVKFIFDMRGFWVDERVEGGLWNLKNPLYRVMYEFFKRKEEQFVRIADAVVVLTEAARQEILSWNLNSAITIVPCCAALDEFDPNRFDENEKKQIRAQLGVASTDYVLLYLGSLGTWYLYDEMVRFFNALKKVQPAAKFLFITQDNDKVEKNSDFIVHAVPRKDVPRYIYASDASICFIKPSFSKKGSSATKMAEILAMGLPIVTNPGWGDVEFLSEKIKNILVTDSCNESVLKEFLEYKCLKNQNNFFHNFFSLDSGVEKYCAVYRMLTDVAEPSTKDGMAASQL